MKQINNWFEFAQHDLEAAEAIMERRIYNQVCFHCQQGVEKMLKGFLLLNDKSIPRTHLLDELLKLCEGINKEFSELRNACLKLDKYYIPTRYPDALPGTLPEGLPGEEEAQEALGILKGIVRFVKKR